MSVWNSPCYRSEPLAKSLQLCGSAFSSVSITDYRAECDFTVDDSFAASARSNDRCADGTIDTVIPKKFTTLCTEKPEIWAGFVRNALRGKTKKEDVIYTHYKKELKAQNFGIKAVYSAFEAIIRCQSQLRIEFDFAEFKTYHADIWKLSAAPSRINQKAFEEIGNSFATARDEDWFDAKNAVEVVRHIWVMGESKSMKEKVGKSIRLIKKLRQKIVAATKNKGSISKHELTIMSNDIGRKIPMVPIGRNGMTPGLTVVKFSTGYFLKDEVTGDTSVLFWKDHERLLQMLTSHSKIDTYFRLYDWQSQDFSRIMHKKYYDYLGKMRRAMSISTWDDCNSICRAFDVALFTYYAELAADLSDRSRIAQRQKFADENLSRFFSLDDTLNEVKSGDVGVREVIEILKTYKILPCPDFCHWSGLPNMARKNRSHREMNLETRIDFADGTHIQFSEEEFHNYQMRQLMVTYNSRHHRLPGRLKAGMEIPLHLRNYPEVPIRDVNVEDMPYIDLVGAFQWVDFDGIEHELVKDKTTAPTSRDADMATNNAERIQIYKYLFDPSFMPQSKVENDFYSDNET